MLEVSQQVSAAHLAPAFSCIEIVDALYHEVMRPDDIFIMSKGHGCLAQYVVLEDMKWYKHLGSGEHETLGKVDLSACPTGLLDTYCKSGGRLGAHPDYAPDLGIHASTGSLGHGLGIAAGQALAEKMKGSGVRVYVLLSDGECQEGSTWEAAMVAANLRLDNLIALVDNNDFGGMDRMSEHHPALAPLVEKFRAFGWATAEVDGHNSAAIYSDATLPTYGQVLHGPSRPRVLICKTTKGKGVSFMENSAIWHYRSPTPEEYQRALKELG